MVQNTSKMAFEGLSSAVAKRMVFSLIWENPGICNAEIAQKLGWGINRVTPRVLELRESGLVEEMGKKSINGRMVMSWRVTTAYSQMELFG